MRIIGGRFKGRRINPPSDFKARPTTDFAREGLFNILNNRVDFESINVLDLFSGTGSMSYEFASRGALSVHLVEKDTRHILGIKKILRELNLENVKPIHIDVKAYLKTCSVKYDIIFADPPYEMEGIETLPEIILNKNLLNEEGVFILEHSKNLNFSEHPRMADHRTYGSVNFSFFK